MPPSETAGSGENLIDTEEDEKCRAGGEHGRGDGSTIVRGGRIVDGVGTERD